jgi:hypothetical protein
MLGGTYDKHTPEQVVYCRRTEGASQKKAQYRNKDGLVIKKDLIEAMHPMFQTLPIGKPLRDVVNERLVEEYGNDLTERLPRGKIGKRKRGVESSVQEQNSGKPEKETRKRRTQTLRSNEAGATEVTASDDSEIEVVASMKSSQEVIKWFSDLAWDGDLVSEKEQYIQVAQHARERIMGKNSAPPRSF